ncbi:MAG: right-handed parallel beta-helix repeat-containing protein, partial [Acidobacteria bacterium]|nr:right-handed parallel beta-helix repeat-containing protein [Acidobacteriota bacterium]
MLAAAALLAGPALAPGQVLESLFAKRSGVAQIPARTFTLTSTLHLPSGAENLHIRGRGAVLRLGDNFAGRAAIACYGCRNVRITGITIEGNRARLEQRRDLPPFDRTFAETFRANGLLFENSQGVTIEDLRFADIAGFAILINAAHGVVIRRVAIRESGSRNPRGRNNSTGGILLENGTHDFEVAGCTLERVRGNGIWTHSRRESPRNGPGRIAGNTFREIGRDAIQVGHATRVTVAGNRGRRIGYPVAEVDVENLATPVAIDTAGNVGASSYSGNRFFEVNGKCIDLDGFHDGEVRGNTCVNRGRAEDYAYGNFGIALNNTNPEMQSRGIRIIANVIDGSKFGGIFVVGRGHTIRDNRLLNLNLARCNDRPAFGCFHLPGEPDFLRSGIYLARKAERVDPSADVVIEDNVVTGWGMARYCIAAAPGVDLA